jgi:hypothetical protein
MTVAPTQYLATNNGTESWTAISQCQRAGVPLVMGRLLQHLFRLGDYFARTRHNAKLPPVNLTDVAGSLESLFEEYAEEANNQNELLQWEVSGLMQYRDGITAITIAYFEAARVLVALTHAPDSETRDDQIQRSSRSILDSVSFLSTKPTSCATLRIFFPLTLVALHGPSRLKEEARFDLDTWIPKSGFVGLHSIIKQHISMEENVQV